ncbi:unnamed protein product [Jaminaea pallidilutea]
MAGPPRKQRYNEKARQSVAGGSSHKKRRGNGASAGDTNRQVILPEEQEEWKQKEAQRRALLTSTGNDDNADQRLSSKKRKRLDAYIASRLKKEARAELLAELAQSSAGVRQGREDLVSARTLGTGQSKSSREILEGRRKEAADHGEGSDEEDSELDFAPDEPVPEERPTGEVLDDPNRRQRILEAASLFGGPSAATGGAKVGSALARGADGKPLAAVVRTRKRKGPSQRERRRQRQAQQAADASDFDSSESSQGSSDDGEGHGDLRASAPVVREVAANTQEDDGKTDSEDEATTDSEEDALLMEAMRQRGQGRRDEEDEQQRGKAVDDALGDEDRRIDEDRIEVDSDGETDSEGEAVLMEAMRRRGLALPSDGESSDGESSDGESSDDEASISGGLGDGDASHDDGEDSREASRELSLANQDDQQADDAASQAESLPWEGFASEQDEHALSDNEASSGDEDSDAGSEDSEGEDGDEVDDGSDDDDSNATDQPLALQSDGTRSRRRGLEKSDRSQGFKDWARTALGFGENGDGGVTGRTEEGAPLQPVAGLSVKVKDIGEQDEKIRGPLGQREPSPSAHSAFAAKHYAEASSAGKRDVIAVQRKPEIVESRLRLPVVQEEDRVVKTILENEVTVICGETGSGKTTQVAQMLFERGFGTPGTSNPGLVGITQPRRVAAVSTAKRVADELNLGPNRVSHQVRYDGTVSPQTSLKFMTDGVLLRELATDLLLTKYSIVIVDEAHERSVNTDVLTGMLSRVVRLRAKRWLEGSSTDVSVKPLRLVIMSATLRVTDFVENPRLFAVPPPLLKIEARQHPVSVHFNRKTSHDYLDEAVKKASKIHTRLPPGGILIFLTGEQEIRTVCKRLEGRFTKDRGVRRAAVHEGDKNAAPEEAGIELGEREDAGVDDVETDERNADEEALDTDDEEGSDGDGIDEDGIEDHSKVRKGDGGHQTSRSPAPPMHILPLYSLLPSDKQMQVFEPPPEDSRLVVVATNVAETSLTIPNIRYVVDCGRAKERKYDNASGISSFKVDWISQASAAQRAGRAGRTGPGHCYRLYSSNVYEEFLPPHAEAEIRRTPVEGLVLQMKSMNIDNVVHFPFPTAPDREAIAKAERVLTRLGALQLETDQMTKRQVARTTELGKAMSLFPLSPRYAKMLVQGQQHGCLPYVIALVAALSVGDLFTRDDGAAALDGEEDNELQDNHDARKQRRRERFQALERFDALGGGGISDAFRALAVVGAYSFAESSSQFCADNFLRPKAMQEVQQLRSQLSSLAAASLSSDETLRSQGLPPPNDLQLKILRQLIACAYIDQVAVRADIATVAARAIPELAERAVQGRLNGQRSRSCYRVPYLALGVPGEAAYVHHSSALYEHSPPEWCVYTETVRTKGVVRRSAQGDEEELPGRVMLRGMTKINANWIAKLGKDMCSFSKPVSAVAGKAGSTAASLAASITAMKTQAGSEEVVVTPTYGTGPACELGERASHHGFELPPLKTTRRWVGGSQGWQLDL